jgi:hypothetical protein
MTVYAFLFDSLHVHPIFQQFCEYLISIFASESWGRKAIKFNNNLDQILSLDNHNRQSQQIVIIDCFSRQFQCIVTIV